MRTVETKNKRKNPPRQKGLIEFCLGCRNKPKNMFEEPCNDCNEDYHSQYKRPKKPLGYTGGLFNV